MENPYLSNKQKMMRSIGFLNILLIVSSFIFGSTISFSQSDYERSCNELIQAGYFEPFDFDNVELKLNEVFSSIKESSTAELENCNCADSVWIVHLTDSRTFERYTHSTKRDTGFFIRNLSTQLDAKILEKEFDLNKIVTSVDSFQYVLKRLALKSERRNNPEYNWMNFYHCVDAENIFLKEYKYKLKDQYFEIFDNEQADEEIRDLIITAYFYSESSIEDEILSRIDSYINERYFYRMLGILRTSGTDKSVDHLLVILEENDFEINEVKSILQSIYGISDRIKIKKKTETRFDNYLSNSGLDSLTRYDLFTRQ